LVAVAILDGEVLPQQYRPERITRPDVQTLLRKVTVRPSAELSQRSPNQMPARITIWLHDGRELFIEKLAYEGFWSEPMRWETVVAKFDQLSSTFADANLRQQIVAVVANLESTSVADLTRLLAQ